MKNFAIIVAGGMGERMKSEIPKQFLVIGQHPILMHSISAFYEFDKYIEIIIVLPEDQITYWQQLCSEHSFNIKHKIVKSGETRFHSVKNAIELVEDEGIVAVHDGVRPLVSQNTIKRCFDTVTKLGNAIPFINIPDSIREVENNRNKPVDRLKYKLIQTPQVFFTKVIKKAYQQEYIPEFTDDASVVETLGESINLVEGNRENIKITSQVDILIADTLISKTGE